MRMSEKLAYYTTISLMLCGSVCHGEEKAKLTDIPAVDLFEVISRGSEVVIGKDDPGAEDIKYGFEGGHVIKLDGVYHMITAERSGDPIIVKMRLAHWSSRDGRKWARVSTLYESSGEFEGKDPRAALWGPMPIYVEDEELWYLVYVAYRAKPNDPTGWYENYEGKIWLAQSTVSGKGAIGGPYRNLGIILQPDADSGPWEGLQGTDSFFPYRVGDTWYGFFGSAQTQKKGNKQFTFDPSYPKWAVGLAKAKGIRGPWIRMNEVNPIKLDPHFAENPVVSRLPDGRYVAMLDGGSRGPAYSVSENGLDWSRASFLDLAEVGGKWWSRMRTPLGLIDEGDGVFTVFHTAYAEGGFHGFAKVGMARLRLKTDGE